MLHAAAVRSPHARARIRSVDASRARARRGVHLVLTAAELGALNQPTPLLIPHPHLEHPRTPYPLAVDEVRYAGELVAIMGPSAEGDARFSITWVSEMTVPTMPTVGA